MHENIVHNSLKANYFFCKFRFKIYTAGASSMQTYSHPTMGKYLIFSLVDIKVDATIKMQAEADISYYRHIIF